MSRWRDPSKINLIVIHCTATPNGRWLDTKTVDGWHRERGLARSDKFRLRQNQQYTSIGYHFLVYTNGAIQSGRHIEETGAHAFGHNLYSIGVAIAGTDKYSPPQWDMLAANIRGLLKRFPSCQVVGHRDLSPDVDGDGEIEKWEWLKTCPGFDVAAWLAGDMQPLPGHITEEYDRTSKGAD